MPAPAEPVALADLAAAIVARLPAPARPWQTHPLVIETLRRFPGARVVDVRERPIHRDS